VNKYFKNIYILTLLFSITFPYLKAQTITPKFDELDVCLPNCVLQDKNGFIWIGAQEGLLRYDGNNLEKYQNIPFDSNSISGNWVPALAEDRLGNLWVSTLNGLNYFNQITEKFTQFKLVDENDSTLTSKSIPKMLVNDDSSMWIATTDCGVFFAKVDKKGKPKFTHYDFTDRIELNDPKEKLQVWDLYKDNDNCLWIGTVNAGLIKLNIETEDVKQFINDPNDPTSLSHNNVRLIYPDNQGNIWIGTSSEFIGSGGGLNMLNPRTGKFTHFRHNPSDPRSLGSDWVFPFLIDSKGVLWANFFDGDIISINISEVLNNKNPDFRKSQHHKFNRSFYSIYEDRNSNIWFCPFSRKLYKYDSNQNPFYWYHRIVGSPNTMSASGTQCIYIDRLQNIWFGHSTSIIDKYNPATGYYKSYNLQSLDPSAVKEMRVMSMCEDTNGSLWIATFNNGLYKMDIEKETLQKIYSLPEEPFVIQNASIWCMLITKTDQILLGPPEKDLILFDPKTYHTQIIDLNPTNNEVNRISSMYEDQDGTIWIGTFNYGLYKINIVDDQFQIVEHYLYDKNNSNSLSYDNVSDIIRSEIIDTNALWIATANGFNRLDLESKAFKHFFKKDGLPDNLTLKVLEDNKGNIWVSCAIGIGRYDIKTGQWKSFGTSDGMPFETFGGSRQNTAKAADGQLFFSGSSGTIGFYPDQIKENLIIPPIYFTDFRIFNESVKLDTSILFKKAITLSHDQNAFSFEFTALNYTNPEKNQYAYKMEGFHDDWIYSGNEHTASFTNLDPGNYVLWVKGSNNHGLWNEEGTSILIIITPPWWATWWFRTIAFLALIGIVYGIYRYRVNKILEMERLRVQIASDLHDDIGSALTRIAVHSEIIQTTTEKEKVSSASKRIGNMSREIITTLSDVVWSIDSRNDTVGDLIDRMRDFLETVFPAGSIHIAFKTKGLHFDQKVEQSLRQNIYLIFKEAVNNAAKHSGADEIKISMINGDGKFKLEISDNGIGMNESEIHKGHHGIENMELRAKRINGKLKIEKLEKGTSVNLITKNI
jgi:ligand-binding sensor domain-containing protein/two-component sensor histidine kinase